MEDRWEQGEAGGKETSREATVVIQARNGRAPSQHAGAGTERERWMWEALERRSLWMLHVGGEGWERDKHDSELLSLGK